ncbi:inverse autotransporter beta domain-containing protein [Bathymodiolus septemdierum thioautotrophic gill symbiont]|nr:inverse autotransporter beta domain-containing protein [Bathymodiolus septemdierum thioautotrophic gill symbiont]
MNTLLTNSTQTHSSIANIAGGHISNVLNKLKQLLLFSALTLSLNVTAVDKPQSFDKEAYLNLNQEYNWNNPQTYYKKDNQGLLILKQVGSTVRNTLGATNSDNANQFGSTLKNNLKNQAINQAVSGTEGYINNKANEYANQFGAGRTEIQLGGFNSEALNYNIRTIQPLSELNEDSQDLIFFQGQLTSGQNHSERRETLNLGIGYRKLLEAGQSIAGINLFTDYETQSAHKRASIGLEYQRTNFKANFNKYQSLSDKKVIGSFTEEVLDGYDVKLEGQIPYLPWAKIKGTRYVWDKTTNANSVDIKGTILGVEVQLSDAARFEFGTEKSNSADSNSYARLSMAIPFKDSKFTNFKIADKAFKNTNKMQLGEFAWVERSNKIRIEKVTNGGTIILGEYNAFTVGATCTITDSASVSTVATTGSDGSVTLPSLSIPAGLVTMSCTGGTYTDEATGQTVDPAPTLRVVKKYSGTGPLTIIASPLSEIAYQLADAAGGIAGNIADKNTDVATAFGIKGVDFTGTIPTDLNNEAAGNDDAGKFGLVLAGISQMQESTPSVTIATLVADLNTDGILNMPNQDLTTAINTCMAGNTASDTDGIACNGASGNPGTAATAVKDNLAILASDSVLADIGTDANTSSTSDTTIAEFGSILPALTDFVNANLSAYQTYIDANPGSFASPATQAEVQAMITAVNAAVTAAASDSVLADIGTDANTASTSDTTIAEFGSILPALTDFVNANLSAYQTYIDANPGSFASPATQAEVQAMITAVNAAVNTPPTLSSSTPADNASAVAVASNIVLTFSKPMIKGSSGDIVLRRLISGTDTIIETFAFNSAKVTIGTGATQNVVTINPTADLVFNGVYHITIASGALTDVSANAYTGITNATTLNFEVIAQSIDGYKTVRSPDTDKLWLDRNLGATQVATSSTDSASYGDLYQWGRKADGHEDRTKTSTSSTLTSDITNASTTLFITSASDWVNVDSSGASRTAAWADGGSNDICPAGFSVPTDAELAADTTGATTTDIINSATAFSSFLKIPLAGFRARSNGTLNGVGTYALLWSRSAYGSSAARSLYIGGGGADFASDDRALGFSVRCIKD